MRAVDTIIKKRDGAALSPNDIAAFIRDYVSGEIPDYQAAALLMAVFFRGMDFDETACLTEAMMRSGDVYDLSGLKLGRTVDKHSTGGVGDKVSLILAPLVAACGVAVPMVSGRGLGHTGGTLDKLESIPGFRVNLEFNEYMAQLSRLGVAMIGQSDNFVPADKRLYALRDVTGTIESIPLICASIMSKKVASGADAFVIDVKVGSGAFMQTVENARDLARGLIGVGAALGRPVRALLTDMDQPLGHMIGNSQEIVESIDCLHGGGPHDLRELTLELAAQMLALTESAGPNDTTKLEECRKRATKALDSGKAFDRFRQMVGAQSGDIRVIDDPRLLNVSKETAILLASNKGWISGMNCREIGNAACVLGAGRLKTTDKVDPGVGLEMLCRIGDKVIAQQELVRIFHRNSRGLDDCMNRLRNSITISDQPAQPRRLIIEHVN